MFTTVLNTKQFNYNFQSCTKEYKKQFILITYWAIGEVITVWVCSMWSLWNYSQTWANGHLWITARYLPTKATIWKAQIQFYNIHYLWTTNHLSTRTSILGFQGWPLYTGLTLHKFDYNNRMITITNYYYIVIYCNVKTKLEC